MMSNNCLHTGALGVTEETCVGLIHAGVLRADEVTR
jgi:hypothetical protein